MKKELRKKINEELIKNGYGGYINFEYIQEIIKIVIKIMKRK